MTLVAWRNKKTGSVCLSRFSFVCALIFFVFFSGFLFFSSTVRAEAPLSIGLYTWAPYTGTDLPGSGFATEVIQEGMKRAGYETVVRPAPWSRVLKQVEQGSVDIIPGLWFAEERLDIIAYGPVLAFNSLVLITRKDATRKVEAISDLAGLVVGVGRDYAYPEEFLAAGNFKRDESIDLETNIRKLVDGRIDATIGDAFVASYTNRQILKNDVPLHYSSKPVEIKNLYIGISRQRADYQIILDKFEEKLREMWLDGTYKAIIKRHGLE